MDLSKGIVVLPPSLFLFLFSFFFFFLFFLASFALSIYLSFVLFGIFSCVLFWDLLFCPLWDLFLTLRATLYILQEYKEDLHTLQEVLNIKKDENYHDVCKCMPLPV